MHKKESCIVAPPRECNCATLKDLANKVLLRNPGSDQELQQSEFQHKLEMQGLSLEYLKEKAAEDWPDIQYNETALLAFADALKIIELIRRRITPPTYTKIVKCYECGEVKLWEGCPEYVLGCPYCLVRDIPLLGDKQHGK